jgi:hypothetical protein
MTNKFTLHEFQAKEKADRLKGVEEFSKNIDWSDVTMAALAVVDSNGKVSWHRAYADHDGLKFVGLLEYLKRLVFENK